jgi:hypothetical protein
MRYDQDQAPTRPHHQAPAPSPKGDRAGRRWR